MVRATEVASAWLLLRAFASGCTAMTGVEAVSNGVMAFREPASLHARRTLTIVIGILMVILAGIAILVRAYGIGATPPGAAGYESVLSQLLGAVAGIYRLPNATNHSTPISTRQRSLLSAMVFLDAFAGVLDLAGSPRWILGVLRRFARRACACASEAWCAAFSKAFVRWCFAASAWKTAR